MSAACCTCPPACLPALQLTSLKELDLSGNVLTELPSTLAQLSKLEVRRHPAPAAAGNLAM